MELKWWIKTENSKSKIIAQNKPLSVLVSYSILLNFGVCDSKSTLIQHKEKCFFFYSWLCYCLHHNEWWINKLSLVTVVRECIKEFLSCSLRNHATSIGYETEFLIRCYCISIVLLLKINKRKNLADWRFSIAFPFSERLSLIHIYPNVLFSK